MSAAQIYSSALVKPENASINLTVDGVEYFSEAPRYADATQPVWKCYAIFPIGTAGRRLKHAAGLKAPGENGENLAGFIYE